MKCQSAIDIETGLLEQLMRDIRTPWMIGQEQCDVLGKRQERRRL